MHLRTTWCYTSALVLLFLGRIAVLRGLSVCWSVCHSRKNRWNDRNTVSLEDSGGHREPRINWGPDPRIGRGNFEEGKGRPIVKYRDTSVVICAKTTALIEMPFGLWPWMGLRNNILDGVHCPDPPWEEPILGKGAPVVKYRHFLSWSVQKRLNRSRCRFGYGLGWAEGNTT